MTKNQLSSIMGKSHQNVKQILLKLAVSRIFNGIDNDKLMITIQTIIMMERNLSEL